MDFVDVPFGYEEESISKEEVLDYIQHNINHVVRHLFSRGKFRNNECRIGSIQGEEGYSLKIDLNTGLWKDFANNDQGDIFDLWGAVKGLNPRNDFGKVLDSICQWAGIQPTTTSTVPTTKEIITRSYPVKNEWIYTDVNGKPIVKFIRKDLPNGKKTYKVYNFLTKTWTAPPENRPLYNQTFIKNRKKVIIVEGEKCADALIRKGFGATTAMHGATANPEVTDWTPLKGKHVCIWADNDDAGLKYAQKLKQYLSEKNIPETITTLLIPQDKPNKWDAYDAVEDGIDIVEFIRDCQKEKIEIKQSIVGISIGDVCADTTPKPKNIISQGLLVQGGLMLLAGEPKSGKSHVLLSMLIYLSAGLPFLGLEPPHPLKIFYLQSENDFFEMRDRSQQLTKSLNPEQLKLSFKNLFLTPNYDDSFTESVVDMASKEINKHQHGKTDLIVVDPLYEAFDAGDLTGGENDNKAMLYFLKKRLKVLRQKVNPNAGMILVHHTRKINSKDLEEIRFDAISGSSGLRRHYSSAMLLHKPCKDIKDLKVFFETRSGDGISTKEIYYDKEASTWKEYPQGSIRLVGHEYGEKLDAERDRKRDVILDIIKSESLKGKVYTARQFREKFDNKAGLGSEASIQRRLDVLTTQGHIKIFKNTKNYGLSMHHNSNGLMCVKDMELSIKGGEIIKVLPTHYKCEETGAILPVENTNVWVEN
ncbi:MAG: hypothetical protein C6D10_04115 [Candidatus Liberibacter solanacearum]